MRGLVVVAVLSGCGRVGFDAQNDALTDTLTDTLADAELGVAFPTFSPCPIELSLVGNASCVGNELELTPEANAQMGAVWIKTPYPTNRSFSIAVTFVFTNAAGSPADGAAITVQNNPAGPNALGPGGKGFGVENLAPSVNIEADTLSNTEPQAFQHVGIDIDGATIPGGPALNTTFDMADGQPFTLWFDYTAATQQVDAYVDRTTTKPAAAFVTTTSDLTRLGTQMYIGVSAGTGTADEQHHVLAWSVDFQ